MATGWAVLGRGVEWRVDEKGMLLTRTDLTKPLGVSASGKSVTYGSTGGNRLFSEEDYPGIKIGVNVFGSRIPASMAKAAKAAKVEAAGKKLESDLEAARLLVAAHPA